MGQQFRFQCLCLLLETALHSTIYEIIFDFQSKIQQIHELSDAHYENGIRTDLTDFDGIRIFYWENLLDFDNL